VISLYGLGRFERGLIGDLGLLKLCSSLLGRRAEPEDTRDLLERYDEWAGLASVYLLASAGPLSSGSPGPRPRGGAPPAEAR
jgi:3-methyladenine DNA glycosylase/8-oxoguanine DNA glycosylase